MPVTITDVQMTRAIRVATTESPASADLLEQVGFTLAAATEQINRYAPDAPDGVANEAAVLFVGWLYDSGGDDVGGAIVGGRSINAFRSSGAQALLAPWRARRGGMVDGADGAASATKEDIARIAPWALLDDDSFVPDDKHSPNIARVSDIPAIPEIPEQREAWRGAYDNATTYQSGDIVLFDMQLWLNIEQSGAGVQGIRPDDFSASMNIWRAFYVAPPPPEPTDLEGLSQEVDHIHAITHQLSLAGNNPNGWELSSVGGVYLGAFGLSTGQLDVATFASFIPEADFPDTPVAIYVSIPQVAEGDTHFRVSIEGTTDGQAYRIPLSGWVSLGAGAGGVQYYRATPSMIIGSDDTRILLEQYPDQGGTIFSGRVERLAPWAEVGATARPKLGWARIAAVTISTISINGLMRVVLEPEEATNLFTAITGGEYTILRLAAGNPSGGDDDGQVKWLSDIPVVHDTDSVALVSGRSDIGNRLYNLQMTLTSGAISTIIPTGDGSVNNLLVAAVTDLIDNHGGVFFEGLTIIYPEA